MPLWGHAYKPQATLLQGHYFDIYVNSPKFPEPWPAPQMTGISPLEFQKVKQARLRQREQQAAASAAGLGPGQQNGGVHESLAAESGVQQPRNTADSTDAETAHGPLKRVRMSHIDVTFRPSVGDGQNVVLCCSCK